ncbi:uncharacterized protein N7484_000385 [Penicillium longicatenatum]|uniref:uncharacterized protein n=1 Tax=Penicillium longicatenatum TaxID=1561947 RepID=UPI0025471653|nr:uncharacterized protein N7484_000385 [Penicillium longicatenatum]KAJ5661013.1 hypothetical protein N7484_000385 [Penicillium longicatenatum]
MAHKKAVEGGRTKRSGQIAPSSADAAGIYNNAMAPRKRPVAGSPTKREPRKAAARGKWSEEQALTSEKSVLIDADLVKLLASSAAWHALDEDEKRQILDLLPADTHPNADPPADDPSAKIPPLPDSFIRYSNNWRDCIRQFQIDLQNGRYDPEWLRQADEARKERENGDFDSFKEQEYEEFWGQKQKLDKSLASGEASKVKLITLINQGVIQIGDVWRFNYVYGRGVDRIIIDKEARVHEINDSKLSFVLPAGERTFLQSVVTEPPKVEPSSQGDETQQTQNRKLKIVEKGPEEVSSDRSLAKEDEVQITGNNQDHISPQTQITQGGFQMSTNKKQSQKWENVPRSAGLRNDQDKKDLLMSSPLSTPPYSPIPSQLPSSPPGEPDPSTQEDIPKIQVVIMSPVKPPCNDLKRPMPQPAAQPPVKRKRGRPPKIPIVEPVESKFEEDPKTELMVPPKHQSKVQVVLRSPNPEPRIKPTSHMHNHDKIVDNTDVQNLDDMTGEALNPLLDAGSTSAAYATEYLPTTAHTPLHVQLDSDPKLEAEDPINKIDEVIVHNISAPRALISHILEVDGRAKGNRTANAWKEIRCYRNNQDMGSLWDVRQRWYFKQK